MIVVLVALVLVLLAPALHRTLVIRIEAYATTGFVAEALSVFAVGAGGGGFGEEEGKEFVWDGEMGELLELLQREKAEEGLEEGE